MVNIKAEILELNNNLIEKHIFKMCATDKTKT